MSFCDDLDDLEFVFDPVLVEEDLVRLPAPDVVRLDDVFLDFVGWAMIFWF
jgi:hypothetical protein